jgi:exodeoxyribonuclease-3
MKADRILFLGNSITLHGPSAGIGWTGSRAALEELLSWGLVDVHRQQHPKGGLYSWWDYRMLAFPKNDGLRLDYVLATQPLACRCTSAEIDRQERKGEKPSDHAPVVATFQP